MEKFRALFGGELKYHVEFECPGRDSLGSKKDWSWCICPEGISNSSLVYSLGVGRDIAFDLAMIDKYRVQIYAFDPTARSNDWIKGKALPENFHFFNYGIASFDGTAMLYKDPKHNSQSILRRPQGEETSTEVQFHTLKTAMEILGHKKIDILKMDIEGAEYEVIENILSSNIEIGQLLVEFHHNKFTRAGLSDTRKAIRKLHQSNFRIFYVSERQREFSFIKIG